MSQNFRANDLIGLHLVTTATVTTDGLAGHFDTLRAALEHLRSHGLQGAALTIHASDGRVLIDGQELVDIVDAFEAWPTASRVIRAEL